MIIALPFKSNAVKMDYMHKGELYLDLILQVFSSFIPNLNIQLIDATSYRWSFPELMEKTKKWVIGSFPELLEVPILPDSTRLTIYSMINMSWENDKRKTSLKMFKSLFQHLLPNPLVTNHLCNEVFKIVGVDNEILKLQVPWIHLPTKHETPVGLINFTSFRNVQTSEFYLKGILHLKLLAFIADLESQTFS